MISEQGTDAWRLQRCGLATASRFADVMATVKPANQLIAATTARSLLCDD